MRRAAFNRLIGSVEAAQQTPYHDQITQLQRLLLRVTGHIDLSSTNFGHLSRGWSLGVRHYGSSKAEHDIADDDAHISVGSPGSVVDKDSGEISRRESGTRKTRKFLQGDDAAGSLNGFYRRRISWPASAGTALPPHSSARLPDAEQVLAAPYGLRRHPKDVVASQPTTLAAPLEAPGPTRPMSKLHHQVEQPGARAFNQPWKQNQDPLSEQRYTKLRADVTEWESAERQDGLSAQRPLATRSLPGPQPGSRRPQGSPTDTSVKFRNSVASSSSVSSSDPPPLPFKKPALARSNSYPTLQAALVAIGQGAPPPSVGELGWLLTMERASRDKTGPAGPGEAGRTSREVSERLDRLLLPHLQGPYGISLTPGKLTQLLWAMVKGGHMGASAAAVLDAMDRTVHPGLPYTKGEYWATLGLWTLGRAQQMARGAGGAAAAAAGGGGGGAGGAAGGGRGGGGGLGFSRGSTAAAAAALVAHARAGVLPKLVDLVCRNVEVINGQGLANFFWAAGQLKLRDIPALATVGERLHRDVRMLDPQNIANVLYGTALLELDKKARAAIQQQAPFLQTLVEEAAGRGLQGFNPQEISNLVWASSKLDLDNRKLLENAAQIIAESNYHERAVAQEWANTLYGMALKDFYDPRVFEKLEMALLTPEQWRRRPGEEPIAGPRALGPALGPARSTAAAPSSAATVARAVDAPAADNAAIVTESGSTSSSISGSGGSSGSGGGGRSRTIGSVTALHAVVTVEDDPRAGIVSSSPETPAIALDPGFGPTTAAANANAAPGVGYRNPAAGASAALHTPNRLLSGATPQTCSNILYAMGMLRHLDERLVDVVLGRLVAHGTGAGLHVLSSTDVALTVRACAQLGYRPPLLSDFLDRAMPRLQAERHRLMAHNMLWALLVLDMLPEPRLQPLVQLLVAAVNRHGISAWAPGSPAMAKKNNPYASPGSSSSASGAAPGPLTAKAGSVAAPKSTTVAVKAALHAEQQLQDHKKQRPRDGEEGVVVAGSWWEDVMEDWSQLLQYHLESRRLGLTGPLYDITASFLPGGMDELERAVRAHRRLVSERQHSLVVQRRVCDMLHQMAADRDPSHPTILHIESEVILDPEATTVDIVVHLARPGTTIASVGAAAGRSTTKAADAAATAAAAAAQQAEDGEDKEEDENGDAAPGLLLPERLHSPAAGWGVNGGLQRRKRNAGGGDGDFRPLPTTPPSSPPGPPPPYLSYKVAIEVDGPWHYMRNRPTMADGTTLNRNRTLERHMGSDNVLIVRTRHWVQWLRSEDERRQYLAELLRATGPPPLPSQPPEHASRDSSSGSRLEPLSSKP